MAIDLFHRSLLTYFWVLFWEVTQKSRVPQQKKKRTHGRTRVRSPEIQAGEVFHTGASVSCHKNTCQHFAKGQQCFQKWKYIRVHLLDAYVLVNTCRAMSARVGGKPPLPNRSQQPLRESWQIWMRTPSPDAPCLVSLESEAVYLSRNWRTKPTYLFYKGEL